MKNELYNELDSAVFYCRKVLDNASVLSCRVDMIPVHTQNRCGYLFTLELDNGSDIEREQLSDVTGDVKIAERLFDLICSNDVFPCHLSYVVEDFLADPPISDASLFS